MLAVKVYDIFYIWKVDTNNKGICCDDNLGVGILNKEAMGLEIKVWEVE
jgi:hypothetical protein